MHYLAGNIIVALLVGCMMPAVSAGQVVENDAFINSLFSGGPGTAVSLGLAQTTSFGAAGELGLFGFRILDEGGDQFSFSTFGTAESYAFFLAEPGDIVAPFDVNTTVPFASNYSDLFDPQPDQTLTLPAGESVFLSYWDDRSDFVANPVGGFGIADADDNYGWLELGRSDRLDGSFGRLELLGGATAIGQGIIVGTTTTVSVSVPEPSAVALIGMLSAYTALGRRKRQIG